MKWKPTPGILRYIGAIGTLCALSGLLGWGVAYHQHQKREATRAAIGDSEIIDPMRSLFVEGDRIPLPRECVYGHNTLQNVEIIWGGAVGASRLEELRDKLERREVVLSGSDVVGRRSKSRTVYCTTCDFMLEMGYGPWVRSSSDPSTFVQPFSVLLRDFLPLYQAEGQQLNYFQGVMNRRVVSERVSITTEETFTRLKEQVRAWAKRYNLSLKPDVLPDQTPHRLYPSGPLVIEQQQLWTYGDPVLASGMVSFVARTEDRTVSVNLSSSAKGDVAVDDIFGNGSAVSNEGLNVR